MRSSTTSVIAICSAEVANFAMFFVTRLRSWSASLVRRLMICPARVRPKKRRSSSSRCSYTWSRRSRVTDCSSRTTRYCCRKSKTFFSRKTPRMKRLTVSSTRSGGAPGSMSRPIVASSSPDSSPGACDGTGAPSKSVFSSGITITKLNVSSAAKPTVATMAPSSRDP